MENKKFSHHALWSKENTCQDSAVWENELRVSLKCISPFASTLKCVICQRSSVASISQASGSLFMATPRPVDKEKEMCGCWWRELTQQPHCSLLYCGIKNTGLCGESSVSPTPSIRFLCIWSNITPKPGTCCIRSDEDLLPTKWCGCWICMERKWSLRILTPVWTQHCCLPGK